MFDSLFEEQTSYLARVIRLACRVETVYRRLLRKGGDSGPLREAVREFKAAEHAPLGGLEVRCELPSVEPIRSPITPLAPPSSSPVSPSQTPLSEYVLQ